MTTWTLYGTDGTELPLDDCDAGTIHLGLDTAGVFGLPPVEFQVLASPTRSAGGPRGEARFGERLIVLELVIKRSTTDELDADIALAAALLNPEHGDCRLVVGSDAGTQVDIPVTYTSGFQPVREHSRVKIARARCTFRASEPFFKSTTDTEQTIAFPVTGSGDVATDWDADEDWDADLDWDGFDAGADGSTIAVPTVSCTARVWPRWEFDGPLERVQLHNATTGLTFDWSGTVAAGSVLSIGMAEDDRHVRVDGVDRWVGLSDESRMWWLKPGRVGNPQPNTILIQVDGADTTTTARMTYQALWTSPPG